MPGNAVELWSGCWALQLFFFVLGAMQYCELQVQVFFTLRLALGFLSAVTEATLVAVVTRRYGARMGMYTLGILCISSGCFNASTSMYVHWLLFPYCQICRIQVAVYKSHLVDQYLTFAVFLSCEQVDLVLLNASWKWKGGNLSLSKFTNCASTNENHGAIYGLERLWHPDSAQGIICDELPLMFTCFCYSGLLPSSFSMYAITLAAALVLSGRRQQRATVAVAAFGVLVGWPFAAMAAAPLVVYSLATGGFLQVFCSGLITTICTMVCSKPYLCVCSFSCLWYARKCCFRP